MPLDASRAPATASPLWIIALFIALSEATAGVAAITTNGFARLIFAWFAVIFPTAVFIVFVWLLVNHAPNLYAPRQYSREITPEAYRVGLSQAESLFLGRAVAETVVPLVPGAADDKSRDDVVDQVARRFDFAVQEASVTVSLSSVIPGADALRIPVTNETSVDTFLNQIYSAIETAIEPFTYGKDWLLADDQGTEYLKMGSSREERRRLTNDKRPLSAVGILPGSKLIVVAKRRDEPSPKFQTSDNRNELVLAREIRARGLVAGLTPAEIAANILREGGPVAGTTPIRAHRLALGVSLADVVAQLRAWYASEGRPVPRFSEALLSAYESGQKQPGPEYLHYLSKIYQVDAADLYDSSKS